MMNEDRIEMAESGAAIARVTDVNGTRTWTEQNPARRFNGASDMIV
jgi:hypothetical protein